jgi:hypothetical protein
VVNRVECIIEHDVELEADDGRTVIGVTATCTCCGSVTEAFGTSSASVRRALACMKEECPEGEDSFYYADDGSDNG